MAKAILTKNDDDELELEIDDNPPVPAATLVKGIFWQAIEGDPLDNAQLRNMIEAAMLLNPDDIRTMVEEFLEEAGAVAITALKAMNKVAEQMKDLDQWDFLRLMDVFETKTDVTVFDDHDQDDFRHLSDWDRMSLEKVDEVESALYDFTETIIAHVNLLMKKISSVESYTQGVDSRLGKHISDNSRHFLDTEKYRLNTIIPNGSFFAVTDISSTGKDYTVTVSDELIPLDGLTDGSVVVIQPTVTNGYAPTLEIIAVDDFGSIRTYDRKPILTTDAKPLTAGSWSPGIRISLVYNAELDAFIVTNFGVSAADLFETAANFDSPVYMRGCEITFDRTQKGIIIETAVKGGVIFAVRKTDYTDRRNIVQKTVFYLEHGAVGVLKTTHIDESKSITEKIEQIEIGEAA